MSLRPFSLGNLCETERQGLLVASDAVVLSVLGLTILSGHPKALALGLIAAIASLYACDQYALKTPRPRCLASAALVGGLAIALSGAPLLPICLWMPLAVLGLWLSRHLWERWMSGKLANKRTILLCEGIEAQEALGEIQQYPLAGVLPLGLVGPGEEGRVPTFFLGASTELAQLQEIWDVDRLVIGPRAIRNLENELPEAGEILSLSELFERLSHRIPVRFIDTRWFIERFQWDRGLFYQAGKRFMDISLSIVGLCLASLIAPWVALLIYLDDPGPVFYSQARVGKDGKIFRVHKFRTMRINAEHAGAVWASKKDERVTRIGNVLRHFRLDEIPQLYNVLKGEMSLVGPRPERPEFVTILEAAIPFFRYRQLVKPGITGWAQVRFPYGSSVEDAEEKLKFDLYYIKNRSLRFDFLILLRTVAVVIGKTGAR